MKKSIAGLAFALTLFSCQQSADKDILKGAEDYLKTTMKDPSSFQPIKSIIFDTVMNSRYYKELYHEDTIRLSNEISGKRLAILAAGFEKGDEKLKSDMEKIYDSSISQYKQWADRDLKYLNNIKTDSILYLTITINYRAKNGFGALDEFNGDVKYYLASKSFKAVKE